MIKLAHIRDVIVSILLKYLANGSLLFNEFINCSLTEVSCACKDWHRLPCATSRMRRVSATHRLPDQVQQGSLHLAQLILMDGWSQFAYQLRQTGVLDRGHQARASRDRCEVIDKHERLISFILVQRYIKNCKVIKLYDSHTYAIFYIILQKRSCKFREWIRTGNI